MDPEERQWHWGEGNKYALECMKALLLLNGGAPIALLTFLGGSSRARLDAEGIRALSHCLFAFGGALGGSILLFVFAYFAQLYYGNEGFTRRAHIFHNSVYVVLLAIFIAFCAGMYFAEEAVIAALSSAPSTNIPPAWFG